jgi:hypothetical protein
MSRGALIGVLAALVVLGSAGTAVLVSERSAWTGADSRSGQKVFPGLRISDVAEIAIGDAGGRLHLARQKDGWSVRERADFPADTDRIGELLVKLAELKVVQREALPESQRARLQLIEPKDKDSKDAGARLELKDEKGALLASLLLGKKILKTPPAGTPPRGEPEATGRYVTAGSEANALLAVSDPLAQVEAGADRWIVKDLIRVDRSKTISAMGADGRQRWTVTRNGESVDWRFADSPLKPDLQKATDLSSALYWINAADVVGDPNAGTGLERPVTVKATTFDGLTYTLRIGSRSGDNYTLGISVAGEPPKARVPAKGEKAADKAKNDKEFEEGRKKLVERLEREKKLGRWTYLVAKSSLDPLLRDRAHLLPEKKAANKKG